MAPGLPLELSLEKDVVQYIAKLSEASGWSPSSVANDLLRYARYTVEGERLRGIFGAVSQHALKGRRVPVGFFDCLPPGEEEQQAPPPPPGGPSPPAEEEGPAMSAEERVRENRRLAGLDGPPAPAEGSSEDREEPAE